MRVTNTVLTLEQAWKITIKKWSTEDQYPSFFTSPYNCGLCQKFLSFEFGKASCAGCPIAVVTKHKTCDRFSGHRNMRKMLGESGFSYSKIEDVRKKGLIQLLEIKKQHEDLMKKKGKNAR